MTWELLAELITLVTFGIAICKIVANNTKVITELRSSVDTLSSMLSDQKSEQSCVRDKVNDHETRITVLEKLKEKLN